MLNSDYRMLEQGEILENTDVRTPGTFIVHPKMLKEGDLDLYSFTVTPGREVRGTLFCYWRLKSGDPSPPRPRPRRLSSSAISNIQNNANDAKPVTRFDEFDNRLLSLEL